MNSIDKLQKDTSKNTTQHLQSSWPKPQDICSGQDQWV